MADDVIEDLVTFQLGELQDDRIALLIGYATSKEVLSKGEMESFVIGMTQEEAAELGAALLEIAEKIPGVPTAGQTSH